MEKTSKSTNFIREIIDNDLKSGKNNGRVHTRFPPEPNGYLHIGHAKSICLNFGIASDYLNGKCNLRFDDTNPTKEDEEYVKSIIEDIKWLGFDYGERLFFASDYFDQMYDLAIQLIKLGKAYVDDQSSKEIKEKRGTLKNPGIDSIYRERTINENLSLFERMKAGEFKNGEKVLRAKIDMNSPNINLRDPIIYRIIHAFHHRTKNKWCIYPMYDWAHGLEDSFEGITHSICTLEFEDHRPLYDWYLNQLDIHHPRQIEFARLNLNYTVMSKRKFKRLVEEKFVMGWDDPRMPTLSGMRRRGYTPESIRSFVNKTGVAKRNGISEIALLDASLREDLNKRARRVMVVIDPVKVIITNYPKDKIEEFDAENNPEEDNSGKRTIIFSRELFIERSDFMENPPNKFFRLGLNREVRLKHAYYITCKKIIKNDSGVITELHCTYAPDSHGGWTKDGRKVRGTLHWVSVNHAIDTEVRMYENLFKEEFPENNPEQDFTNFINPESLIIKKNCKAELIIKKSKSNFHYQFLRMGYFYLDKDSTENKLIFNKTTGLRDSWKNKNT